MTRTPPTPARGIPASPIPGAAARRGDMAGDANGGQTGNIVGGYRLLATLGEGGMGVVYLARRPGEDRVALKVLRPHVVGDEEARRRLAREVGSLSRIKSRWVAEILDADPWAPVPYIATRYVPGLTLHDFVPEEGTITGADLSWFALCLARGIASVHAAGVLHRDVKPSNVIMEGRTPILIDFGVARVAEDPKLTHTGWLIGTPGYLAPEILYGDPATAASDVWSWAATVAFAATGRPPFGRGPSMAIMDRSRRGEFDLSEIGEPMRSLLAACLNPDPQRRPTVRDLIAHLEPPALSRPQPQTPRALAQRAVFEEPTRPYASASAPALADHTLMATERRTVLAGDSRGQRPDLKPVARPPGGYSSEELPASAAAATLGKRVRRFTLGLAAAGVCGGLVALNPFWGGFALAAVVWLLRSGSLAASEVSNRRQQRGRRWYDGPLVVLRVPWELLRASIGSVLLAATGLALALAVALLGYAFGAGDAATLFGCGFAFAVAVWTGPGGSGVRAPLARLTAPVAVRWQRWLPVFFVLLVLATGLTGLAQTRGTSWEPVGERPLSGPVFGL